VFEQELAPTIVQPAEAVVPKANCSTETVRNECSRVLNRLAACGTLRAFRHSLNHSTSFGTLELSELGGGWDLRNEFKQFQGQTVNPSHHAFDFPTVVEHESEAVAYPG
jgi:hypothetical protein